VAAGRDSKGRFTKVGARFEWDSKLADSGVSKTRGGVMSLQRTLGHLQSAAGGIGSAVGSAFKFAEPAVAMFKAAAGVAIEFEGQMSAVNAVLMTDDKTMDALAGKAKQLGASTKFTAKQAAEGMEMLASAGFSAKEIMVGIEGTLSLAAAGALDLASASEITGNVINGMGLKAQDATHVADVLAKVAADTSTDVRSVGVAFKYSSGQAKAMGLGLEETAYLLGSMADAGLKGSSGGTALSNMLSKIAKPTEKGAELFKKWKIAMEETGADGVKRLRPVQSIMADYARNLNKIKSPLERASIAEATFGKIGLRAYNALDGRIKKHMELTEEERKARSVDSFMPENVAGAAKKMADLRLVGVAGAFEIAKSSAEGFMLELFSKESLAPMEMFIKDVGNTIGGITQVMQQLGEGADPKALEEKWGPVIVGIAQGVRDAMQAVREAFAWIREKLSALSAYFGETVGGEWIRSITKFGVLFIAIAAIGVPIIATLAGIGLIFTTILIPAVIAFGSMVLAAFGPLALIGIILWYGLEPFVNGLMYVYDVMAPQLAAAFGGVFTQIGDTLKALWGMFDQFFSDSEEGWTDLGRVIGGVIGGSIMIALDAFKTIMQMIQYAAEAVRDAIADFSNGDILGGLKKLGSALVDLVLEPFRWITRQAVDLADAVGVEIPDAVRGFASGGIATALASAKLSGDAYKGAGADEDESSMSASAPNYAYVPSIGENAANVEAGKKKLGDGTLDAMQEAMEGALATNEANKKPCETTLNHSTNLDGKAVAKNQAKYKSEMDERAGFKNPPYQRDLMSSHGNAPGR
jgi:TP901 family phage tail tape measure protein